MKSKMYNKIEKRYKDGLWPIRYVRDAADKGKITAEEYAEITGEKYGDADEAEQAANAEHDEA